MEQALAGDFSWMRVDCPNCGRRLMLVARDGFRESCPCGTAATVSAQPDGTYVVAVAWNTSKATLVLPASCWSEL